MVRIRGKPGFCVEPKGEAHATEAEQEVEKNWDSGDTELLVQVWPADNTNL